MGILYGTGIIAMHGYVKIIHTNQYITINITGIVMHDNKWDTTASPAATDVSFPAALGITIVFSPNGIANMQREQIYTVEGNLIKYVTPINKSGIRISLIIDIK